MAQGAAVKVVGAYLGKRVLARLGLGKLALLAGAVAAVAKVLEATEDAPDEEPST